MSWIKRLFCKHKVERVGTHLEYRPYFCLTTPYVDYKCVKCGKKMKGVANGIMGRVIIKMHQEDIIKKNNKIEREVDNIIKKLKKK